MPDGAGLVFEKRAGTGAAVILPRTGLDTREVFAKVWADTKAKKLRDTQANQLAIKNLEKYRADGWYKDDVVLQEKVGKLRDLYGESIKQGLNPESIDPNNKESVRLYNEISKAKDNLALTNAYSKQSKNYFEKQAILVARNPQNYTPESVQSFSDYYDLPLNERMQSKQPRLEAALKPEEEVDWMISGLDRLKVSLKSTKVEKGEVTITTGGANVEANLVQARTFLNTAQGEAMIKSYGGDEEEALKVAHEFLNAKAKKEYGRAEDEAKVASGGKKPTEEDILARKEIVWKLQHKDPKVIDLLSNFMHPKSKLWIDGVKYDDTGDFTKIILMSGDKAVDSIDISEENSGGEIQINRLLNIAGKGKAGPQVSYESDWRRIPKYKAGTGTQDINATEQKQIKEVQVGGEGSVELLEGKEYKGGKIKSAVRKKPTFGDDSIVITMESGSKYIIKLIESEGEESYGYKEIRDIITAGRTQGQADKLRDKYDY